MASRLNRCQGGIETDSAQRGGQAEDDSTLDQIDSIRQDASLAWDFRPRAVSITIW